MVLRGETVDFAYDSYDRLILQTQTDTLTDAEPRVTRLDYHGNGEVSIDGPRNDVNDVRQLTFDETGNLVAFANAAGHLYLSEYDDQDRLIRWSGPNGEQREFQYDEQGRLVVETAAPGAAHEIEVVLKYNEAGLLIESRRNNGLKIRRSYDDADRLATVSSGEGQQLRLLYEAGGVVVVPGSSGKVLPGAGVVSGQTHTSELPDSVHSSALRVAGIQASPSGPVSQQYDRLGRVVAASAADGSVTYYEYNGFGEVIAERSPSGETAHYSYDAGGNRIWEQRRSGTVIYREFDALGRMVVARRQRPEVPAEIFQYRYDDCAYGVGHLCQVSGGAGSARFEYNIHGSLTQVQTVTESRIEITQFRYNANHQLEALIDPSGLEIPYYGIPSRRVARLKDGEGTLLTGGSRYEQAGPARMSAIASAPPLAQQTLAIHGEEASGDSRNGGGSRDVTMSPGLPLSSSDAAAQFGAYVIAKQGQARALAPSTTGGAGAFSTHAVMFYRSYNCSGIPNWSAYSLEEAWYAGLRSFLAPTRVTLYLDDNAKITFEADVCFRIDAYYTPPPPSPPIIYIPPSANPTPEPEPEPEEEEEEEEGSDEPEWPPITHDYAVDNKVCSTTEAGCNLPNIACWLRHYHAPGKDSYDTPVGHSDEVSVDLGWPYNDEPIKVAVGPSFGLPKNAIAQIPLEGHALHNDESGEWGSGTDACPQSAGRGTGQARPDHCNQVYREVYEQGGSIRVATRGTGNSGILDGLNQSLGPGAFGDLDDDMIEAFNSRTWCPGQEPPSQPPGGPLP